MNVFPVILAGGSGTRLWPMSGEKTPKQFLKLLNANSLFQNTVNRMKEFCLMDHVRVVCGEAHGPAVARELISLGLSEDGKIYAEPCGRNTGPAIMLAAERLLVLDPEAIMVVLPADHVITDDVIFQGCLHRAVEAAKANFIVTLGIVPNAPETGYGYMEVESFDSENAQEMMPVKRFVEKPDEATARTYLDSGRFFWNAGIFVFKAAVLKAEMQRLQPKIVSSVGAFLAGDEAAYATAPNLSIDYAVMEHTDKCVVVPAGFGWSDLGSWSSVYELSKKDEAGNSARGDVLLNNCKNSYFRANTRLLVGLGVEDLVAVETDNAVLIAHKSHSQDVKKVAHQLQERTDLGKREPVTEHRPWGSFTILGDANDFKTKRLDILPGKRLSLQLHQHRTEYWVIIHGKAIVTRGEETLTMTAGDSVTIPAQAKHRIENPGPDPLAIIEVQLGTYFGEDDIVRLEDDFGRTGLN